jgi:hypothetical protein
LLADGALGYGVTGDVVAAGTMELPTAGVVPGVVGIGIEDEVIPAAASELADGGVAAAIAAVDG